MNRIQEIMETMKSLEKELIEELQKKENNCFYKIQGKRVCFDKETKKSHKTLATRLHAYILYASSVNVLTVPIIWLCIFPIVFLDLVITIYQSICFRVYRIPLVKRSDYIVMDRNHLAYLNAVEKLNCAYCSYVSGILSYAQEIVARTEQFWCPIKHAMKLTTAHNRYRTFIEYGDAEEYRKRFDEVRKDYSDLKEIDNQPLADQNSRP
jgi:hypothetical protein